MKFTDDEISSLRQICFVEGVYFYKNGLKYFYETGWTYDDHGDFFGPFNTLDEAISNLTSKESL